MDKVTIDTYNRTAHEYDTETAIFWKKFPRAIIDTFAESIKGRVLDVGSGPGRDGLLLQEKGLEVTCFDASEAMVELSASRGLHSILGDLRALPFPKDSFEGVWAYTSLLHVQKSEVGAALEEIRRVLVPSGVLGLGLIEGDTERYKEGSAGGLARWFSYYQEEEIEQLLREHRFTIEYFERFTPGPKDYLNFICRKD